MNMHRATGIALSVAAVITGAVLAGAQTPDGDRARGLRMLRDIKKELRSWYYDAAFGGRDIDALFAPSKQGIARARSQAEISGLLAQAVLTLDDSHTYFIPSPLPYRVDYGFEVKAIGDKSFVTAVKPGSLAEADGLLAGMALSAIEGAPARRDELWKIFYALNAVRPRRELRLQLDVPGAALVKVVRATTSEARPYERFEDWIQALDDTLRSRRARAYEIWDVSDAVVVVKLHTFDVTERQVDEVMKRAIGKQGLVLDLRENGGGAVTALVRLASYFFPDRRTIGGLQRRKGTERLVTEPRKAHQRFDGKLVVLVDSQSASASEVLARMLQLEQRATIVGDRSAGSVMVSMSHTFTEGHEGRFLLYGLSITHARLVMTDGASLEGHGVVPDEVALPAASDLADGRDPVLARATALLGVPTTPAQAGKTFPRRWE